MYIKPFIKIWHTQKKVYMKFPNLTGIKQDTIRLDLLKLPVFHYLYSVAELASNVLSFSSININNKKILKQTRFT